MENQNEKVVQELNELIESGKSGKEAYDTAIQHVDDPKIKTLFTDLGNQHEQSATELEKEVQLFDKDTTTRPEGRYQTNTWTKAKTAAARGNYQEILDNFEKGETEMEKKYDEVLKEDGLPENIKEVVRKQHDNQRDVRSKIHDIITNKK